jgi:hypothetical protein
MHKLNLTDLHIKKLLSGKPIQLQHHVLIGGGLMVHFGKAMLNKVNSAVQKGMGVRLRLDKDELKLNIKHNPNFKRLLTKARARKLELDDDNCDNCESGEGCDEYEGDNEDDEYNEYEGGAMPNVNRSFRNFGKTLNRQFVKPINNNVIKPIIKNKEGIARSVGAVAIPLLSSIAKKVTGLNFSGGDKIMSQYTDRRIQKDLGRRKITTPDMGEPSNVPQSVTTDVSNIPNGSTHGGSLLINGTLGFSMANRKRRPIGKPKPQPMNLYNGSGLRAAGGCGLFAPGYSQNNGRGLRAPGY